MIARLGNNNVKTSDFGANLLRYCLDDNPVAAMRAASPLPELAQRLIDQAVVRVGRQRLAVVDRLLTLGLTYSLPNWLSVLELGWDQISEAGYAKRSMVPQTRGENERRQYTRKVIPVYCTSDDFSFNVRDLAAAARNGTPLDTSHVEGATRNVNEAVEDAAINGIGKNVAGNGALGFINAPNAATVAYTGGEAWDVVGHTGEEIYTDVSAMIDDLQANKRYGPYELLVPTTYGRKLSDDYRANDDRTIRARLLEIEELKGITTCDFLPANRTVLFQATSDIVDVIVGQTPATVTWEGPGGWDKNFVVLSCIVPRVKDDYEGKSGICVGNTT